MSDIFHKKVICPFGTENPTDIPKALIDETTTMRKNCNKYHTLTSYLFCIIFRLIIGIIILNSYLPPAGIIVLCLLVLGVFIWRKISARNEHLPWGNFDRIILIYSLILILNFTPNISKEMKTKISGLLIIIDPIIGFQSRHYATIYSPKSIL